MQVADDRKEEYLEAGHVLASKEPEREQKKPVRRNTGKKKEV